MLQEQKFTIWYTSHISLFDDVLGTPSLLFPHSDHFENVSKEKQALQGLWSVFGYIRSLHVSSNAYIHWTGWNERLNIVLWIQLYSWLVDVLYVYTSWSFDMR